jgi:mannose-6-phosphate isomerase
MSLVSKPWGHEVIWSHTEKYVGKLLVINAGHKLSLQYHEVKDETIYVLEGTLSLHVGETEDTVEVVELKTGESYHITPGTIHRFEAKEPVTLIEVSTPELDDVVRLRDDYGREGT